MNQSGVHRAVPAAVVGGLSLLSVGCSTLGAGSAQPAGPPEFRMIARRTPAPIRVDGTLDEAAWAGAIAYPLVLSRADEEAGRVLAEAGSVRLRWDNDYLYVAVDFSDSDVVAEGEEDHLKHFLLGDLAEVFLKPAFHNYYWELYVTPRGYRSTFFFPSRGRHLPSTFQHRFDLRVAARIQGTLNDWSDTDIGWTAEMAIPVSELTAHGAAFGAGAPWKILVARYNYGKSLAHVELSAAPRLSRTNFHLYEDYAILDLVE